MKTKSPKLAVKILQMAKSDQNARKNYTKDSSALIKMLEIDSANLVKMKKIVKEFGWPSISSVGKHASHMAWLLVQHADRDVKFQEYCLGIMKKALKNNEVLKKDIAYLTDRILVNRGKPQIYGTQFYNDETGCLIPRSIINIENLEKRRKKIGLESFKIYSQKILK